MGITFAKLQEMETGGRFRIDSLALFADLAAVHPRPRDEVLEAAGIRVLEPETVTDALDDEAVFAQLVLPPALRGSRCRTRLTA